MKGSTRFMGTALLAFSLAACSGSGGSSAPASGGSSAAASSAPASSAAASSAGDPGASGGSGTTVQASQVGSLGTVLVAANGMTVYTFTKDTANSGTSACTGDCIAKWPAVTISSGSPTAGDGVTGKLGTITRPDDGSTQVTYNGLPLYFFAGDQKPGDGNGVYTNWQAVTP